MRAKRQILSLLLALLLVWQGFSFANAETGSGAGAVVTAGSGAGREATPASDSTIPGTDTASSSTISGAGSASKKGKAIENALFDVKLLVDKKPVQEIHSFANYQSMQFAAKINVKGLDIEEGDYISIQLPHELRSSDLTFDLKTPDQKKLLAKGEYNQATKEMLITFTKEAKDSNVTNGEVFFNTEIDTELIKESIPAAQLELKINGKTVINQNLEYLVVKENSKSFYKDRSRKLIKLKDNEGNTHYLIRYTVTLDTRNIEKKSGATSYTNVVFTDTLQSNALSYFDVHFTDLKLNQADIDTYAPVLRKGIWRTGDWVKVPGKTDKIWKNASDDSDENRGPIWSLRNRQNPDDFAPAVDARPNYSTDGRSFTYSLGTLAPDDGYELSYYVEINGAFKNGDKFYNQAKLDGKGIDSVERLRDFEVSEAGGFLEGQNFSIQIEKVGDDGKALQGAEFTLFNPKSKYTKTDIVTNENGIVKLENVLKADYVLTEVKAPEGYDLDSTPLHIYKTDFDTASNSTITLTIKNKKTEVEKKSTSFSVEKRWVLDSKLATNKPDKVTVSVLKNGVKDDNLTVVLSQENGWKASFSNLPKKGADGKEIVYTVSEEELAGFKSAISGTDENGFTISNYNGSRVVIPVTKIWKGNGTHPDHVNVQLWADEEKVATYTLNEANAWQHSFDMPKFNTNHKEIRYKVTEDSIPGYTATTQSNPATGYVNVFVNTKNDVPPTSPNGGGNGGGGNGGGGNPPKPSPSSSTPPVPSGNTPNPGEVLNASRPSTDSESVSSVLGAEREKTDPKGSVLGAGRGYVKTEDSSSMPIYFLLFALTGLGLTASILWERKRAKH